MDGHGLKMGDKGDGGRYLMYISTSSRDARMMIFIIDASRATTPFEKKDAASTTWRFRSGENFARKW